MNKIFTDSRIAQLDQYTIENEPISSGELIERAARTFCNSFCSQFSPGRFSVIVFAGPGNNGADGLAIGRILAEEGYKVQGFFFDKDGRAGAVSRQKKELFAAAPGVVFSEVEHEFIPPQLTSSTIVIDALFGTGLSHPLEGGYAAVVKYLNASDALVVSVDIPSGLFSEDNTGNPLDTIVRADYTYTFEFPKLAFFFRENENFVGSVKILPIELSAEGKKTIPSDFYQVTDADISNLLPRRPRFSHKGNYGHALLIAGSRGMIGAALLSARAAMRSGLGRLTCHIPACGESVLQSGVPEAMLSIDPHTQVVTKVPDLSAFTALGIGPGLGKDPDTVSMLSSLLEQINSPIVIDADALNIIAENPFLLDSIPQNSILTPHPGELSRLTSHCTRDSEALSLARELAQKYHVFVVLKGAYSATCTPRGMVFFNCTGNPGMATAGSGDVLTGIITGLLAQGYESISAAILGNYLHGMAGDIYMGLYGESSLIASDIIDQLPKAFAPFNKNSYF